MSREDTELAYPLLRLPLLLIASGIAGAYYFWYVVMTVSLWEKIPVELAYVVLGLYPVGIHFLLFRVSRLLEGETKLWQLGVLLAQALSFITGWMWVALVGTYWQERLIAETVAGIVLAYFLDAHLRRRKRRSQEPPRF